jgi:hypothetical protein
VPSGTAPHKIKIRLLKQAVRGGRAFEFIEQRAGVAVEFGVECAGVAAERELAFDPMADKFFDGLQYRNGAL